MAAQQGGNIVGSAAFQVLVDLDQFNAALLAAEQQARAVYERIQKTLGGAGGGQSQQSFTPPKLPEIPLPDPKKGAEAGKSFAEQFAEQLDFGLKFAAGGVAIAAGQSIFNALLTPLTGGGALIRQAAQDFLSFDQGLRQAAIFASATGAEVEALKQSIITLGQETSKTPDDIARVAINLGKAGFAANDVIPALEGITRASEATGESIDNVSDITAKTLRVFNLAGSEAARVGDVLVQGANQTNTSVVQLGEALKYAAPLAAAANQNLEETVQFLGLLSDTGQQASVAGTGFAEVLREIQNLSAGGGRNRSYFEQLGLDPKTFRDSLGQLRPFSQILKELQTAFNRIDTGQKDLIVNKVFGDQGGRVLLALLNQSESRITEVGDAIRNAFGTSIDTSKKQLEGLPGSLTIFTGSLETLRVQLFEIIAPGFKQVVDLGTQLVNAFISIPGPIKASALAFGALAAAAVAYRAAASVSAAILATESGALIANTAAKITNAVTTRAGIAATAAQAGAIATQTAAWIANTAALIANRAASVGQLDVLRLLSGSLTGVANATKGITIGNIFSSLAAAGPGIKALAASLGTIAGTAALVVGSVQAVQVAFREIAGGNDFTSAVNKGLDDLNDKLKETGQEITGNAPGWGEALKSALLNPVQATVDGLRNLGALLDQAVGGNSNLTDRFGGDIGTSQQLENRRNAIALEQAQSAVNDVYTRGIQVFQQFGITSAQVASNTKLSADQLKNLKTESEKAIAAQTEAVKTLSALQEAAKGQGDEVAVKGLQTTIDQFRNLIATQKTWLETLEQNSTGARRLGGNIETLAESLKQLKDSFDSSTSAAEISSSKQQEALSRQRAAGTISEREYQDRLTQIQEQSLIERVAILQKYAGQLSNKAQGNDQEATDAKERLRTINQDLAKTQLQIAEGQRQARSRTEQQALEDLQRSSAQAIAVVEQTQAQRVAAVRRAQAQGILGEEQAAAQISQIQQQAIAGRVGAEQAQLERLNSLRQRGQIDDLTYQERRRGLITSISQLAQQAAEAELEAAKRIQAEQVRVIEQKARAAQLDSQAALQSADAASSQLRSEQQLLGVVQQIVQARSALAQARAQTQLNQLGQAEQAEQRRFQQQKANLEALITDEEQRKAAIAQAEAVSQLRLQQIADQKAAVERRTIQERARALEQEQVIARQLLEIEIQQSRIAAQRSQIEAQSRIAQAQAEVAKAVAQKQPADVVNNLQRAVQLQQQALAASEREAAFLDSIADARRQALDLQQAVTREQLRGEAASKGVELRGTTAALPDPRLARQPNAERAAAEEIGRVQVEAQSQVLAIQERLLSIKSREREEAERIAAVSVTSSAIYARNLQAAAQAAIATAVAQRQFAAAAQAGGELAQSRRAGSAGTIASEVGPIISVLQSLVDKVGQGFAQSRQTTVNVSSPAPVQDAATILGAIAAGRLAAS